MKYFSDITNVNLSDTIVTVGVFDGIHLGHRAILSRMNDTKTSCGGEIVVITFNPHPREVIEGNGLRFNYINSKGRKIHIMANLGVDVLIDIPFTPKLSMMSSYDFLNEYIISHLHPSHIVVGYDCHFGHDDFSTMELLSAESKKWGYKVIQVPPYMYNGQIVSSSLIRKALNVGDVETANKMLGYEYNIYGQVIYGQQIGRTMGFPTANLFLENDMKLITANGVYACRVKWHGNMYIGMCNIGFRPTVNGKEVTIEVNIFDFDEEIYGENICVFFCKRMRDEVKFNGLENLKKQLEIDREDIRRYFAQ